MKIFRVEANRKYVKIVLFGFIKIAFKLDKDVLPYHQRAILDIFDKYGYNRSLEEKQCVDYNGKPIPWYTYPAIEYISQFDFSDKRVFEFGSGNSSLWWANRAKEVVSVENDEGWYNSRLSYKKDNLKINLRKEKISYSNFILEQEGNFDVIVIDGEFRLECAITSLKKIAVCGGYYSV